MTVDMYRADLETLGPEQRSQLQSSRLHDLVERASAVPADERSYAADLQQWLSDSQFSVPAHQPKHRRKPEAATRLITQC